MKKPKFLSDLIPKAATKPVRLRKKFAMEVTLTFCLDEQVTPDIFATRVAQACANYYALRPGEAVRMPSCGLVLLMVQDKERRVK